MIDLIKFIAFVLSLIGIYFQTKKKMAGWYFHLASNATWIAMLAPEGQWVLVLSSITYSALNVYGIYNWSKNK